MASDRQLAARWPGSLVEQVASGNFVLVVGAGISAHSTNASGACPPGWGGLLTALVNEVISSPTKRKPARELIGAFRYLEAAEYLRSIARSEGKEEDVLKKIARATDGGGTSAEQFQPAAIHQSLMSLSPTIVVTTNYDKILERATNNGFNVHSFESTTLAREVRQGNPVIVKVHGTVDDATKIVITRSDYSRLRRQGSSVLEVLEAIFLTRTVLFVGYGMGDPDIQLLLENVLGARGEIAAHFLLTGNGMATYQRDVYQYCYGTSVVTYAESDYIEMARMIDLLAERAAVGQPA
jgi:hypothetical protein